MEHCREMSYGLFSKRKEQSAVSEFQSSFLAMITTRLIVNVFKTRIVAYY